MLGPKVFVYWDTPGEGGHTKNANHCLGITGNTGNVNCLILCASLGGCGKGGTVHSYRAYPTLGRLLGGTTNRGAGSSLPGRRCRGMGGDCAYAQPADLQPVLSLHQFS